MYSVLWNTDISLCKQLCINLKRLTTRAAGLLLCSTRLPCHVFLCPLQMKTNHISAWTSAHLHIEQCTSGNTWTAVLSCSSFFQSLCKSFCAVQQHLSVLPKCWYSKVCSTIMCLLWLIVRKVAMECDLIQNTSAVRSCATVHPCPV